jgi:hypothetical protein
VAGKFISISLFKHVLSFSCARKQFSNPAEGSFTKSGRLTAYKCNFGAGYPNELTYKRNAQFIILPVIFVASE